MDIIKELADLAFASRLKRLSERLSKDVSLLYRKLDVDFEARWFSILYTLNRKSPMAVTEIAQSLGLTHTAINQLAKEMIKNNLLYSSKGEKDERQRLIYLSDRGNLVVKKLQPVWEEIRSATKELVQSTGCDLLAALGKIEEKLGEQDMYERVWFKLKGEPPGEIRICEYTPALKKHFKSLNYEWLEDYFEVETADEKILSDPKGKIVKNGGAIFFACVDENVIGTAALIRRRDGALELTKMAVTKKFQGRGIGAKLLQRSIDRAKELGAVELFLQTSTKLKAANHLYRKAGFKKTKKSPADSSQYNRPKIMMKLDLKSF